MFDPKFDLIYENRISALLEENVGREFFKPGLSRLKTPFAFFYDYLKENDKKIVTVSGTNGKGETCLKLKSLLDENGLTSTLWSSPHVLSIRERYNLVNGLVDYNELESVLILALEELENEVLSYYELAFYCFCKLSVKEDPDVIIFEVGLGGRFDAVNLFDPTLCGLTSISRDHEEILGPGLSNILKEKLGIARPSVPFFYNLEQSKLRDQAKSTLDDLATPSKDLFEIGKIDFEMDYSTRNQILATELYNELTGDNKEFEKSNKTFKGRFEEVTSGNIRFIFIGAHNLDGIKKTRDLLLKDPDSQSHFLCSFSKRSKQDLTNCMKVLLKAPCLYEKLYITGFDHFKSDQALVKECSLKLVEDFEKAAWIDEWKDYLVKQYESKDTKRAIYVMGSYYFIGEVQRFIIKHRNRN